MAGKGKTHQRIFRELEYLQQCTEKSKPISIDELNQYLDEYATTRQIIYQDFAEMEKAGIGLHHHKNGHYYYERQDFTEGELSLMIDLLCCAGYPDTDSARKLILHIKQIGNNHEFANLTQIENLGLRNKSENKDCIINTEMIHKAIREKKQIQFSYERINSNGDIDISQTRFLSPYSLVWNNSRLYVIGGYINNEEFELRSFRVDKIYDLQIIDKRLVVLPKSNSFYSSRLRGFDAEKYLKATFEMFGSKNGTITTVKLCVANSLIGAVIDQFGNDIQLIKHDYTHMEFTVDIQISNIFFGWIAKFTYQNMHILYPESVRNSFKNYLLSIVNQY